MKKHALFFRNARALKPGGEEKIFDDGISLRECPQNDGAMGEGFVAGDGDRPGK